jgi:phospholipase/lecithinase/hemolysin
MKSTKGLIGLIAVSLTAGCAAPAPAERAEPAERVERIVAFGDSFADDGNIFELFGSSPPPVYPLGRFSNGTNFVDTMGRMLGVPIANFALGGAVTGAGRNNSPAGFDQQYRAFLAGGGPAYYPRVSGKLSRQDLVVVSIGGNDARAYWKSFGAAPSESKRAAAIAAAPAAAARSVANAERGLQALAAAGAHTIVFLGGDVGRLPEVRGRAAAPIGSAFSASYNQGVKAALARLAARNVSIHYVDLDRLAERVEGDPAAYKLLGAGACPAAACLRDPALADKYLFHADKLHLSAAGYAIIGRQAVAQLKTAPLSGAASH